MMFEYSDSLTFGNTKIIATSDKKIAMQAAKMIGITTDESGVSKAFALDNMGE